MVPCFGFVSSAITKQTELKKGCLKMLEDPWVYGSFGAMQDGPPPDFGVQQAFDESMITQFFEQAFEWE